MIELRGVKKRFGAQVVLDGVDFDVNEGETVALLGPSGTGKSVLLKHIIGLLKPDAGTITVDGKNVAQLKRKDLVAYRQNIGYVFQNGALFDSMDVFENVRLGDGGVFGGGVGGGAQAHLWAECAGDGRQAGLVADLCAPAD